MSKFKDFAAVQLVAGSDSVLAVPSSGEVAGKVMGWRVSPFSGHLQALFAVDGGQTDGGDWIWLDEADLELVPDVDPVADITAEIAAQDAKLVKILTSADLIAAPGDTLTDQFTGEGYLPAATAAAEIVPLAPSEAANEGGA